MTGSFLSSSSTYHHHVCEDVVMDILSRLPSKSLVRFRCVCKLWYDLIKKNPDFIEKHLQRNLISESNASLLFVGTYTSRKFLWISSTSSSSSRNSNSNDAAASLLEEGEIPSINPDSMPFYHVGSNLYPSVLGPVRGIYCAVELGQAIDVAVAGKGIIVSLCNPALREVKNTPELPHPPTTEDNSRRLISGSVQYGFGYDSKNNDFKVVAIRGTFWSSDPTDLVCVFLYTLRSNSWKQLDNLPGWPSPQPSLFLSHGNGVVYWLDKPRKQIIAFDLGTEVFTVLTLPDAIKHRDDAYLAVFNDTLAAIRKLENRRNSEGQKEYFYEVWVMKECAVNNKVVSWTKLYNIGPFLLRLKTAFRFWNNGEIIFSRRTETEDSYPFPLVSYNPIKQQFKDLPIRRPVELHTYMESLVSIV